MYVNDPGAFVGATKLPPRAFHSAICTKCNGSSLIHNRCANVSLSIIRMSLVHAPTHAIDAWSLSVRVIEQICALEQNLEI
jgi:hypothetical protein